MECQQGIPKLLKWTGSWKLSRSAYVSKNIPPLKVEVLCRLPFQDLKLVPLHLLMFKNVNIWQAPWLFEFNASFRVVGRSQHVAETIPSACPEPCIVKCSWLSETWYFLSIFLWVSQHRTVIVRLVRVGDVFRVNDGEKEASFIKATASVPGCVGTMGKWGWKCCLPGCLTQLWANLRNAPIWFQKIWKVGDALRLAERCAPWNFRSFIWHETHLWSSLTSFETGGRTSWWSICEH